MTSEEQVKQYFPDARMEDDGFMCRIYLSKNGLGFEEEVACNLTEEQAWDDAWEWAELYLDYPNTRTLK